MATAANRGSIRAYARWRAERKLPGGTHGAVRQALIKKRIKFVGDGILDFEQCDRDWEQNTDAIQGAHAAAAASSRHQHAEVNQEDDRRAFLSARTRREQAQANQAELKYAQASGEVTPSIDGLHSFAAIGRIYAAARESVPRSIAPLLVGKTDISEIQRIIREAIRAADENLCEELLKRYPKIANGGTADLH